MVFSQLSDELRARHPIQTWREDAVSIRVGARTVLVHQTKVLGADCLILAVELGAAQDFDVQAAMAETLRLPLGGLVRRDAVLALRHVLRAWDTALVIEAVELMARSAEELIGKALQRRRSDSLVMFANFAA